MASNNDYHYGGGDQSSSGPYQQQGYYGGAYVPSPSSTPAPSYHTVAHPPNQPPRRGDTVSPFDTVFDDPSNPTDSTQDGFRHNPNDNMNNQNYYGTYAHYGSTQQSVDSYGSPDTAYHGAGAGSRGVHNQQQSVSPVSSMPRQAHFADDIPLQNQPQGQQGHDQNQQPKDVEMNDHVYEAPGASQSASQRRRRGKSKKVGFGQLGMIGADKQRIPFVCYIMTIAQIGTFIGTIAKNAMLTSSPIMIKPFFNPMIGPSFYVLINTGARYVSCMHNVPAVQEAVEELQGNRLPWPCPNTTSTDEADNLCSLGQLCGFGGVPDPSDPNDDGMPNQWFRFILPMFLHAGLIHLTINMIVQLTLAKDMERAIGSVRFLVVYVSAGIFANVLGANYAGTGEASMGASGALFGIIALTLLDLFYSWKDRRSPVKDLLFILLDIVICFVLGLLPGLDNFAHIGGFLMGLCLGISVLHSPNSLRRRMGSDTSYTTVNAGGTTGGQAPAFHKNPMGFFKGRKPLWWAWWLVRAAALVTVVIVFIVLLTGFYNNTNNCSWCKYLSCIDVNDWCERADLNITITHEEESRRMMFL